MGIETISILPALPITSQFNRIHSTLKKLIRSNDQLRQELFFKAIDSYKLGSMELLLGKGSNTQTYNSWSFHGLKIIQTDLGIEKHFEIPSSLISEIRKDLISQNISWVYVITPSSDLVFSIAFNHYLIWSNIQDSIKEIFFATLISDEALLNDYSHDERIRNIEYTSLQLRKICSKKKITNQINQLGVIDSLFIVTRNLSRNIDKYISETLAVESIQGIISAIGTFVNFEREILHIIDLENINESKNSFLSTLYTSIKQNESFWILDIFETLFLEIFPLISENAKPQIGSYYTPLSLAATIVNETLDQYDSSNFSPLIFDPAMGTGVILIFALEWLVNVRIERKRGTSLLKNRNEVYIECITGNDIDKNAIHYAEDFFQRFCARDIKIPSQFTSFDYIANYLKNPNDIQLFDVVLTNPPYIPFHSRFAKNFLSPNDIANLKARIPIFIGIRDNFYLIFMGLVLEKYLSPSGILGIVLDHSFLDLPSYGKVRKALIQRFEIRYILKCYDFKSVATVDLALMVIAKRKKEKDIRWQDCFGSEILNIPPKYFLKSKNTSFRYLQPIPFLCDFFDELKTRTDPLIDILEIKCGLEYGGLLKTTFLSNQKSDNTWYPVIDGSNGLPSPYILFWIDKMPNSYVRYDKAFESKLISERKNISPTRKKVILISGKINRFLQPKIILRQTGNRFIAGFDSDQYLTLRNTHVLYAPKPPYSLYLILGILNSSLGNFLGEQLNIIRSGGTSRYPQIRINDLMRFPVIKITNNMEFIAKVEKSVEEAISIGKKISTTLSDLWYELNGQKIYKTQKYFLRKYLNSSILFNLVKEKDSFLSEQLLLDIKTLEELLIQIDRIVCRLYGISRNEFLEKYK